MAPSSPPRLRVDAATGATRFAVCDAALAGTLPVVLTRRYHSADPEAGLLGPGWRLGLELDLHVGKDRVTCHGGPFDGAAFAPVARGTAAQQEATGLVLEHLADAYVLRASPLRSLVFLKRHAQGDRHRLSAIRAGTGQALQIERTADRITSVRTPLGQTLQFTYGLGALERIDLRDAGGRGQTLATYSYGDGRLRSAAGPDGRAEHYAYDGGLLVTHRSRSGIETHAQYDAEGRCLALWSDDGTALRVAHDLVRHTTRVLDASGGQALYRHVLGRQVLERIDHGGESRHYYYDEAERLAGHGTAADTLAFQRLDPGDHRLAHLHREDRVAFVQYDAEGLAEQAEDAFEHGTAVTWNDAHQPVGLTTALGNQWTLRRDEMGRVAGIDSPEGRSVRLGWTPNRLEVSDADGTRLRETWDVHGRLIERVDRSGRREQRRYHAAGQLAEVRFEGGPSVEFLYDGEGRVVGMTDSERRQVRYDRDTAGRITRAALADGRRLGFAHDALGRIASFQDAEGATHRLMHDDNGRLLSIEHPGGTTSYRYDDGVLVTDGAGERAYNRVGDLVRWTDAEGLGGSITYGPSGDVMAWEQTRDGDATAWLLFEHDGEGRLSSLSGHLPEHEGVAQDVEKALRYDRDGGLVAVDDSLRIERDSLGRPARLGTDSDRVALRYDAADRLIRIEGDETPVEIAYDALDRPLAVRRGSATTDLRDDPDAVASEILTAAMGDSASLALRAVPYGVVLMARWGRLALPIWTLSERRAPRVTLTARRVAVAIQGIEAALPRPETTLGGALGAWLPDAHRDHRIDHTAVPLSGTLGLSWDALDAFVLDAPHLEATPWAVGAVATHRPDPARDPTDAVTGPHRRGVLRPDPWRRRSIQALVPVPDLIALGEPITAEHVVAHFARRP